MHHTHNLLSRFAGGLLLLLSFCLVPSFAQIIFDGSPGTGTPPATLGPYSMTPFGLDNGTFVNPLSGVYTPNTMMVNAPAGSLCGGAIMFAPMTDHRRIPASWNQNWGAYQGDVYWAGPGNPLTITLPVGTHAFYFYANSENFGTFNITAMSQDGTTSGPIAVTSSPAGVGTPGAKYFGFYTTSNMDLMAIKITTTDPRGVAVGQFGISCQAPQAITTLPSDQKAGSFLVFPYYTSKAADGRDTRISISNVSPTTKANLHVFFIDGSTCYQMDTFVCLTPNATLAFKTSDFDPETTGFLYVLAVSPTTGVPIQHNALIGNAFVQDGEYVGNYGAESFWAYGQAQGGAFDPFTQTALVNFGSAYDAVPSELSVTIQSPSDKPNQKLVLAPVAGDLNYLVADTDNLLFSAAAQSSTGQIFNEQEKGASFTNFLTGTCLRSAIITTSNPRIPNSVGNLIPSGMAGSLRLRVRAAVGLLMTPRTGSNAYNGIRTLHKTATTTVTMQVPVFPPVC